jgi:hypothetical protein
MTSPITYGYLERPYLADPYLTNFVIDHLACQVELVIRATTPLGSQTERVIEDLVELGSQVDREVQDESFLGSQVDLEIQDTAFLGSEVDRFTMGREELGSEVDRLITDGSKLLGSQVDREFQEESFLGSQVNRKIGTITPLGSEVDRLLLGYPETMGSEIRRENYISHWQCNGYLYSPYLSGPYLTAGFCAHVGNQVDMAVRDTTPLGSEVDRSIRTLKSLGSEVDRVIEDLVFLGSQVERVNAVSLGSQVRFVLYNNRRIRILCDFPSRGAAGTGNNAWGNGRGLGLNWQASSTLAGDFSANNLNNDIVEFCWRSNGALTATLACDTEINQGIAPDTVAILNHNWTSSAVVIFEGSNDSAFSSIGASIPISATRINSYYVAPTLPTAQFRYWRINISDTTNLSGFLQVGTVVFGSAIIFQGEDIIDQVRRRTRHFSDKVPTEGYTNVVNDRAIKRAITISFNALDYEKGNFENLMSIFETARTSLKCLWMPDPQDPTRFTVFGKLNEIPEEEHQNLGEAADIVNLVVEVDESL